MPIELKTWYTLSSVRTSPEYLVARFLPDHLLVEAAPALTVTVARPSDATAALSQLERFRTKECVVEISLSSGVVELWAEYDEEPTRLLGEKINYEWSAYSAEEAIKVARALQNQLSAVHSENVTLAARTRDLNEFVDELLRRAEAKRSLTATSTAVADGQIDVLKRVLNKLTGA